MNARLMPLLPVVLLVFALAACSSNKMVHAPLEVTIGQQLIDLKNAHKNGALSDAEYDQQRRRLIQAAR